MSTSFMNKKPQIKCSMVWIIDKEGRVTIESKNKGIIKRILRKPKISYIHLDEIGSFVWKQMDGKRDVAEIGQKVKENFGESSEPLYERLMQFFGVLKNCKFIEWIA